MTNGDLAVMQQNHDALVELWRKVSGSWKHGTELNLTTDEVGSLVDVLSEKIYDLKSGLIRARQQARQAECDHDLDTVMIDGKEYLQCTLCGETDDVPMGAL